jgi:radical SAM superfamily enzyme YgiQ (UPF0313 family)
MIYFINPALDGQLSTYSNDNAFPPLGIISLGTEVKHKTEWKVKVFDSQITPFDEIVTEMRIDKPSVVGLSVLAETYKNSIDFAKIAKECGATTVFGNDQAAMLGDNILKVQQCVDYICTAEHGEMFILPFLEFMDEKIKESDVPFMIYREKGQIVKNPIQKADLKGKYKMDRFMVPDRTLLPKNVWDIYLENYKRTYGYLHDFEINGVTTINRGRGCPRGNGEGRCIYCGIMDLSIKTSSPQHFWNDIESADNEIKADVYYEVFDSLSSVPMWLKELIANKPEKLSKKEFFVYAQAKQVTQDIMDLYKQLGVKMVNMGMDSGDDTMLKRLKGKGDGLELNHNSVKLIKQNGMHTFASFVLGSPGETEQSLQNTKNFIKSLVDNRLVAAVEVQPLMVRVGSKMGGWFDKPEKANFDMGVMGLNIKPEMMSLLKKTSFKWKQNDIINTPECSDIYFKVFTEVTYQRAIEISNEIVQYAKDAGLGSGSVGIKEDYKTM